jgi:hypothetical protein
VERLVLATGARIQPARQARAPREWALRRQVVEYRAGLGIALNHSLFPCPRTALRDKVLLHEARLGRRTPLAPSIRTTIRVGEVPPRAVDRPAPCHFAWQSDEW